MLNDSEQRSQATDPARSFIVQAPAGSGKTEILTQRFLRLLARVDNPEQIIALTFTRKAANEMRERILQALQNRADGVEAQSAHQLQTFEYANAALERDRKLAWKLLEQPNRLRIFTIDSLCQNLCQAIPLLEKDIPYANVSDKAFEYYAEAARNCLRYLLEEENFHPPLQQLLQHLDNQQDKLLSLFASLLQNRDQWLSIIHEARTQDKAYFEQGLEWIENHELERFKTSLSQEEASELQALIYQFMSLFPEQKDNPLRDWTDFQTINRDIAMALAELLLSKQQTLRKALDHHVGLSKGSCEPALYAYLRSGSKDLFSRLLLNSAFVEALKRISALPAPKYRALQWEILQALFTILPLLAAHLHLVFAEHQAVDFSHVAELALSALGEEDNPTDLTLYLDHQIQHLLVDEFQDTSIQQFQLLSRLVQGFQPDDGKTLFVVGDPMQSIYRFRAAEVGLFLRAKLHGIGPVYLHPLELSSNFRSAASIVDWVNSHFKYIFPGQDDIESGAVRFHPSVSNKTDDVSCFVKAQYYADKEQEAQAIAGLVQAELAADEKTSIAILVRSRTTLIPIIQELRKQKIPFQGLEIDLLSALPHLRDLWTLSQALLRPGNRLHLLALLRSPYSGIRLEDLHILANYDKNRSLYFALSKLDEIEGLSEDGRLRASYIYQVLDEAFKTRHQYRLVVWINNVHKNVFAERFLQPSEQQDVEQFWRLLEQFEVNGQLKELKLFEEAFNKLYSQQANPSRLQIMTIHKSKGLEFDSVILPALSARPNVVDNPLLRWLKLPTKQNNLLLVSPIKAAHEELCLLYNYIGKLDSQKNQYEIQRLFYVAATRAKKRLYLLDNREQGHEGSFRNLLQNQLFEPQGSAESQVLESVFPCRNYLPLDMYRPLPALISTSDNPVVQLPKPSLSRLIGICTHELLQWICSKHPSSYKEIPWNFVEQRLTSQGILGDSFARALYQIQSQIQRLWDDPVGRWIIQEQEQEQNEYALLIQENGEIKTRIIDRYFLENGCHWIVDFKTGQEDERSRQLHRKQVNEYAELFRLQSELPICCGLYYLEQSQWIHWDYVAEPS